VRGGRRRFKLRFRRGDRQTVCYLGSDPAAAEAARQELADLQRPHRTLSDLARVAREVRRALRVTKRLLAPSLAAAGYTFHGFSIRRRHSGPAAG
jgi:hypothetical protein